MSQSSQEEEIEHISPVLAASVHDVRYFSGLLRGVNFANRATVTITSSGFTVAVEEARSVLATAYVFADIFDEYTYTPAPTPAPRAHTPTSSLTPPPPTATPAEDKTTVLEIPLATLIDCLNIFGTAGAAGGGAKHKRWLRPGDDDDADRDGDGDGAGGRGRGKIDQYFTAAGGEKSTGMRMTYTGEGHPLTLLVAEESTGPTATCEITTYDAEPRLELPFDAEQTVLKIILKSSWLRDALSELDPSFDKVTFIGNPPTADSTTAARTSARTVPKPMLRIHAAGSFGSTEMDYPNDREVLETFECARSVSFSYRYAHIARTLRALQSSTKTSLRIDEEGLLSLQFLMPSPKPRGGMSEAFIEFRCLPLDEDI
ncbi:Rad1-domain-containing protein [Dentipellis sp. KUC8613]|nr:Rad1-domain-containing protein [Dentipellis sp. KUC8613]